MNLLKEGIKQGDVKETGLTKKVTIDGHTEPFIVYKVKLDCLYYNDQNDRIATWISKYKTEHGIDNIDMSNIKEYNNIIQGFIIDSNPEAIKKTRTNIELVDQREPGVILTDGRIIDGNRRFTCLRELAKDKPRFGFFETIILEKDIKNNAKQIKMLELMIQHGEESKVDYNPIDRLVGVYNDIVENKLLTVHEYAQSTGETDPEVTKKVELAKLLVDFLDTINAPKQFYIARDRDLNGPLNELYAILKKEKDEDMADALKNAVFANFLMEPSGDMTRFIRNFKSISQSKYKEEFIEKQIEIAEEVLEKLPEPGKVDQNTINKIRGNEELRDKLKVSMEKTINKVKATETRNKPSQILEKVEDSLAQIDVNIFQKLNEEQLSTIVGHLDKIEELIDELRNGINV